MISYAENPGGITEVRLLTFCIQENISGKPSSDLPLDRARALEIRKKGRLSYGKRAKEM
jgi:hypothetical protein